MPTKIYFVVHNFSQGSIGGVNKVVSETANELAKSDFYDVNILCLSKINGVCYPVSDSIKIHSLNMDKSSTAQCHSIFKLVWMFNTFFKLYFFYLNEKEYSVWNLTSPPLIILFSFFRKRKNKFIYCEHTSPLGRRNNAVLKLITRLIMNTGFLTISLNKKDDEYYKSLNIKSELIYNGISFPENNDFTKEKIIIFVGRFEEEKKPLEALEIFCESRLWERNYKLKFYGSGTYLDELKSKSFCLGINDFVEIITNENDPDIIYKDASCLIMTSKFEGLPTVLIEAMSRGIPCISYNCPQGPSEIIVDGINGFLIKNNDKKKFVETLEAVEFSCFSETNIVNSVAHFNIKKIIKKWHEFMN